MTVSFAPTHGGRASSLALRYALRELRGGLRGFYVFIGCIALGVMAIAGVGSVAASLGEGLAREGRTLRRGDVARHGARRRRPGRVGRAEGGGCRLSDAGRIDPRPENAGGRSVGGA